MLRSWSLFSRTTLALLFAALLLWGCTPAPLHIPASPAGRKALRLSPRTKGVLFTLLMRRVAVSRSQGKAWVLRQNEEDYRQFQESLREMISAKTGMELLPDERILDHNLYLDGFFPLKARFFLNPLRLPIVSSTQEEEYMLRMSRSLEDPYFITVLADSSVTKTMFTPATIKATLVFNLYDYTGLLFTARAEARRKVLPVRYSFLPDRANPGYEERMHQALSQAFQETLTAMGKELEKIAPPAPSSN